MLIVTDHMHVAPAAATKRSVYVAMHAKQRSSSFAQLIAFTPCGCLTHALLTHCVNKGTGGLIAQLPWMYLYQHAAANILLLLLLQDAVNFALYSSGATGVTLVLFTEADLQQGKSTMEIKLLPDANRTGDTWHIMLPSLDTRLLYGFRVYGLHQDVHEHAPGHRFDGVRSTAGQRNGSDNCDSGVVLSMNAVDLYMLDSASGKQHQWHLIHLLHVPPNCLTFVATEYSHVDCCCHHVQTQVVLDPHAKAVLSRRRYGELGPPLDYSSPNVLGLAPTWPQAGGCLPQPEVEFDWEGDKPLGLPMEDLVVYEMHVRGFTAHASSGVQAPGTYLGLIEKLDYLKRLGVNAIELLPVMEFNELEYYTPIPGSTTGAHRYNFWGYSTVNFFSPMARYSFAVANGADGAALQQEFKLLVREAHKRGIEVRQLWALLVEGVRTLWVQSSVSMLSGQRLSLCTYSQQQALCTYPASCHDRGSWTASSC